VVPVLFNQLTDHVESRGWTDPDVPVRSGIDPDGRAIWSQPCDFWMYNSNSRVLVR
jgi:hypothetical protein